MNFILVRAGSCMASSSLVLQRSGRGCLCGLNVMFLSSFYPEIVTAERLFARVPAVPPCIRPHSSREACPKAAESECCHPRATWHYKSFVYVCAWCRYQQAADSVAVTLLLLLLLLLQLPSWLKLLVIGCPSLIDMVCLSMPACVLFVVYCRSGLPGPGGRLPSARPCGG